MATAGAEVRFYGTIANTPDTLRSLCRKLSKDGRQLHFCYEAGPCGYGVQRQLTRLGHRCDVVAPALIPRKVGDKVKTDRRDAMMLAQTLRAGQLTAVWVPDEAHEAMRDLVRLRAQAMRDLRKTRQQLLSFLLRHGLRFALWPLDEDASALAGRTDLRASGPAPGARRDAAADRACRGAVRSAEAGDPRTGAAMVAGAGGPGDPGAARRVADRRGGDRRRGRLLRPVRQSRAS